MINRFILVLPQRREEKNKNITPSALRLCGELVRVHRVIVSRKGRKE